MFLIVIIIWVARTPADYPENVGITIDLPEGEDNLSPAQEPTIIDPELLALIPKSIPGHELGWLTGQWFKNNDQCADGKVPYIEFSAASDGLYTIADPEPIDVNIMTSVNGRADVNPGERGFTYVTPPNWDDAYLRIKLNEQEGLDVEFVEFDRDGPDWKVTDTFVLQKCD